MAVYRHMDIGTAKPSSQDRTEVTYYGIDLVDPCESFSVGDYLKYARGLAGNAPMIVVGGTGLYIKALIEGIEPSFSPDTRARESWNRFYEMKGIKGLAAELESRSPRMFAQIKDKENPRRLIRALELAEQGFDSLPHNWHGNERKAAGAAGGTGGMLVGLRADGEEKKRRIEQRVERMYRNGLVEETADVREKHGGFSHTASKAIGYSEVQSYLVGDISLAEAKKRTVVRTRQLAKKQRTWFRRQAAVDWVDVATSKSAEDLAREVIFKWLEQGPVVLRETKDG